METTEATKKRTIWNRIWYPNENDYAGFRVFQMTSIPVIMILTYVMYKFFHHIILSVLLWFWLVMALLLGMVTSTRFRINNPKKMLPIE